MLVEHLPRSSASVRATAGEAAEWGLEEHLLAGVIDLLAAANWQRQGKKNAPRPKPVPRPGVGNHNRMGTARPLAEIQAITERWKRGEGVTDGR